MTPNADKEQSLTPQDANTRSVPTARPSGISLEVAGDLVLCGMLLAGSTEAISKGRMVGALMLMLVVFCVGTLVNLAQEGKGPQP